MGLTVHAGGEFDARNKYHDPYQLTSLVVGMAAKLSVLGPTRVLFAGPEALETSLNHMRQLIQLVRALPFFLFSLSFLCVISHSLSLSLVLGCFSCCSTRGRVDPRRPLTNSSLPPSPLSRALLFLPQHQEAKKEQEELATIKQVRRQVQAKFPGTKLPEIPSEMAKEKVREGGRCRPSMHLRREAAFGQGVEKDALKHVTFTLILTYTTTTTT